MLNKGRLPILLAMFVYIAAPAVAQVEQMRDIPRLSKTHYSWPLTTMVQDQAALFEWVRITGACSLYLDSTDDDWYRCVAACIASDGVLAVNYSPFRKIMNPLIQDPERHKAATLAIDGVFWDEVFHLWERLEEIHQLAGQVEVAAVLLDSEKLFVDEDTVGIRRMKHDMLYRLCKWIFPQAAVSYWGHRMVQIDGRSSMWLTEHPGWGVFPKVSPAAFGDWTTVVMYQPAAYVESWLKTKLTRERDLDHPLIAWISIGAGWGMLDNGKRTWEDNLNYPIGVDHNRGRYINKPPRHGALTFEEFECVGIYPNPERTDDFFKRLRVYAIAAK